MNPQNKWVKIAGFVLNLLIAGLMIFAASGKITGNPPEEVRKGLEAHGLLDRIQLIGIGEMTAAILMIIPWTSPLGVLLTSSFWGGVICLHMAHGEDFVAGSVLLALTWVGAYLRGSVPLLAIGAPSRPPVTEHR